MSVQLALPAGWARNFVSLRDPQDQLAALRQDVLDAKHGIRLALEKLAEKHGIPTREVDQSMGWADDALSDLIYEIESDLKHEIETGEPA